MSDIAVNFTYKVPNGKNNPNLEDFTIESWTYTGPERLWVFVDKTTMVLQPLAYLTIETNGETYNPLPMHLKVEIDAKKEPLLATIVAQILTDDMRQAVVSEKVILPDGNVVYEDSNPPPQDVYRYDGFTYSIATNTWQSKYVVDNITWDSIKQRRDLLLSQSDARVKFDIPDSIKQPWIDYRQLLRDIPTTWAEYEPWQVRFPETPKIADAPIPPVV